MKIIIFGTGSYALGIFNRINKNVEVVAASDNDKNKWWTSWNGLTILPPQNLKEVKHDYIIVASMYTEQIVDGLLNLGLDVRKILCVYNKYYQHQNYDKIISKIFKNTSRRKIALITNNKSGCNSYALYLKVPKYIRDRFDIDLIKEEDKVKYDHDIYISTHLNFKDNLGKVNIDLWHGFPIKRVGLMHKVSKYEKILESNNMNNNINICMSYSNLYNFLMSSCMNIRLDKFRVTGMPRNDLLSNENSKVKLQKVLNTNINDKKVIFYMPTFRTYKVDENIIQDGSEIEESIKSFNKLEEFLIEKNLVLVVKKHSAGDNMHDLNTYNGEKNNIFYLTNCMLEDKNIDLYEILGASDILITDYSSVYFDYLLLDRPVIFHVKDYDVYRKNRGLLLEPYEFWAPGPKTQTSKELKEEIEKALVDKYYYSKEREQIKNIVHKYKDFNSRERVWKEIYNYISNI